MHRSGFVSMPSFAPAFLSRKKKGKALNKQGLAVACQSMDTGTLHRWWIC